MAAMKEVPPEKQLDGFIAKYTPEIGKLAHAVLKKMRKRLPGAIELVYDNYNFLVIGFGPTDRPSEAVFSVVLAPRYVSLCFIQGARLADPDKLLRGTGKQVRNIRLDDTAVLDRPAVRALMEQAIELGGTPFDRKTPGRMVIRAISAKQRPRRPAGKKFT
jgi:hypothetical protein